MLIRDKTGNNQQLDHGNPLYSSPSTVFRHGHDDSLCSCVWWRGPHRLARHTAQCACCERLLRPSTCQLPKRARTSLCALAGAYKCYPRAARISAHLGGATGSRPASRERGKGAIGSVYEGLPPGSVVEARLREGGEMQARQEDRDRKVDRCRSPCPAPHLSFCTG